MKLRKSPKHTIETRSQKGFRKKHKGGAGPRKLPEGLGAQQRVEEAREVRRGPKKGARKDPEAQRKNTEKDHKARKGTENQKRRRRRPGQRLRRGPQAQSENQKKPVQKASNSREAQKKPGEFRRGPNRLGRGRAHVEKARKARKGSEAPTGHQKRLR